MTLPGVFSIARFEVDTLGFCAVIGLELWGLINLLRVGNVEVIYVVFLFIIDLLFALFRHLPMAQICMEKNKLVVEDDPASRKILERRIRRREAITWFFSSLIIAVAFVKIFIFYALQHGVFTGLTAAILLSYLIAAILHITVTGYFLFGLFTRLFFWYDGSLYLRSKEEDSRSPNTKVTIGDYREALAFSGTNVMEVSIPLMGGYEHRLEKIPGDESRYRFRTWGVLTDQQLRTMINRQGDKAAIAVVAREGLKHQLDILEQDPQVAGKQNFPATEGPSEG